MRRVVENLQENQEHIKASEELVIQTTLYDCYLNILSEGMKRTRMKRDDVYPLLPPHLQVPYGIAIKHRKNFTDTPLHREIVLNLKNEIFGKLPNFTAPVKKEHADGFLINGIFRQVSMFKDVAERTIDKAMQGLHRAEVVKRALIDLKGEFDKQSIDDAVNMRFPHNADRCFVAKIVQVANSMKEPQL